MQQCVVTLTETVLRTRHYFVEVEHTEELSENIIRAVARRQKPIREPTGTGNSNQKLSLDDFTQIISQSGVVCDEKETVVSYGAAPLAVIENINTKNRENVWLI